MEQQYSDRGAYITEGPQHWQVFQRGADDTAEISLAGKWICDGPCIVEARVACEDTGRAASDDCDWQKARVVGENQWAITLKAPVGGPYVIETRLRLDIGEWWDWWLTGDKIYHVAVGDLWVLAGQSNTAGNGRGPAYDPVSLGVHMLGADMVWKMAAHPIHDHTQTAHPANRDEGFLQHSPWLTFARQIFEATGVPIGLLPTALGGSPLRQWDPYEEEPVLYDTMMHVIASAGGKVAGMAWYQGESDESPELSATYGERFARFIKKWRQELGGADLPVLTAQLNRVIGQYDGLKEPWWGVVREAQRQAAHSLPNVAVLPALDLPLSDVVHNSASGNMVLGERFAAAALAIAYGRNISYKAPEIAGAARSDDGRAIRLEFENVRERLISHEHPVPDFTVEEEGSAQAVAVVDSEVNSNYVILRLQRPLKGKAWVHGALSKNPAISIKDTQQRPILGFYRFPIA